MTSTFMLAVSLVDTGEAQPAIEGRFADLLYEIDETAVAVDVSLPAYRAINRGVILTSGGW